MSSYLPAYDIRQYRSSHARTTGRANRCRKQAAIKFMHESLASRPELLEYTTPSFPFEARRTVITDSYYTALLDPKVTLVPHGIKELTAAGTGSRPTAGQPVLTAPSGSSAATPA